MNQAPPLTGLVGPFWVVEADGHAAIIALAVPLEKAEPYGDMLTVGTGHIDHWTYLSRRGARALRADGIPTAPVWSEYEEWPRGRVLFNQVNGNFIIRADRQLHHREFIRLIQERFGIADHDVQVLADDHYHSVRRIPRAS